MLVSNPKGSDYGDYLSIEQIKERYMPSDSDVNAVTSWLGYHFEGENVEVNLLGDMIRVKTDALTVETTFETTLKWHSHDRSRHRYLRAVEDMTMPSYLLDKISLISLNSPINSLTTKSGRAISRGLVESTDKTVSIVPGNEEVLIAMPAICFDGSTNGDNVPCSNSSTALTSVSVNLAPTNPLYPSFTRSIDPTTMTCLNNQTNTACNGNSAGCYCWGRVAPLNKYVTYTATVTGNFADSSTQAWGSSYNFTCTDVATPEFLSDLYGIPYGLNVRHGSRQAVAEWYNESWSPEDLYTFLTLTGLKPQHIQVDNVFGNNPPSLYEAGGEAQLDVEYMMGIAQDAETSFYSIGDDYYLLR